MKKIAQIFKNKVFIICSVIVICAIIVVAVVKIDSVIIADQIQNSLQEAFSNADNNSSDDIKNDAKEEKDPDLDDDSSDGIINSTEEKTQMYEVYKYALETFYKNYDNVTYTFFDIDNNGFPELIYQYEFWKYQVYSYSNNNLVDSGEIFAKYGIACYDSALYTIDGGTGYIEYCKIELNDNLEVYHNVVPFLSRETLDPAVAPQYLHNREEITEAEFTEIENTIVELDMLPIDDLSLLETLK